MPEPLSVIGAETASSAGAPDRLSRAVAAMGGRLADLLATLGDTGGVADARTFLAAMRDGAAAPARAGDPLERLTGRLGLVPLEAELVVLAAMADEHEGYARVLRHVHPEGEPAPTAGLAAQLLAPDPAARARLRELLAGGAAVRHGVLELAPGRPFHERSLRLADGLWAALHGLPAWPQPFAEAPPPPPRPGLDEWLETAAARRAVRALARGVHATVLVSGQSIAAAHERGAALAERAGAPFAFLSADRPLTAAGERLLGVHAAAADAVPVLRLNLPEEPSGLRALPALGDHPGPVVFCVRSGAASAPAGARPLLAVPVEPLGPAARRAMWGAALPALRAEAEAIARLHRVEPAVAAAAAADVRAVGLLDGREPRVRDVTDSLRARAGVTATGGLLHVRPRATWDDLVLAPERARQLREALDRLLHQRTVLDDWGFLAGRPGARGVRMLFAGPPGTGKTLSAEVLAGALGVDLLVADLSRIVSKWLGETERNLAAAFDAAERAHAVLLFDEADALFGKRTEIADAHDRYANLETAYLLARLERFDGLAILATNLRRNIDPAFTRRLEFIVAYEEPGPAERERLWRVHLPERAPLAADLDPAALAVRYPVVGGVIRNAAAAAAFLAAAEGRPIGAHHVLQALRREYDKAGRAFPGPTQPGRPIEEVRHGAQDTR